MVRAIVAPELRTKPTNANMALLHDEWTAHRGEGCWQSAGGRTSTEQAKGLCQRGSAQRVQEVRKTKQPRAATGTCIRGALLRVMGLKFVAGGVARAPIPINGHNQR